MTENAVVTWMQQLDRLLRGEATKLSSLRRGTIELPENGLTMVIFALGLLYGGCMGCFALLNRPPLHAVLQLASSMAKVPCLFFLTLVVTFPSLYVFNALVGSRLSLSAVWRLMIAMLAVMMAILASLGPIVAFFSLSTNNYGFMLMLNVAVFALAGFLGLKFLLHTLHRLSFLNMAYAIIELRFCCTRCTVSAPFLTKRRLPLRPLLPSCKRRAPPCNHRLQTPPRLCPAALWIAWKIACWVRM